MKEEDIFYTSKEFYIEMILILSLFVLISYLVQTNIFFIQKIILNNMYGMITYIFLTTIAVVIAPISATPLLPIASNLWGWVNAAILSIIGWTLGSIIAFFISRRYGTKLVRKIIPINRLNKIKQHLPNKNLFWVVVGLRAILPVDILSYALGLFTEMKYKDYILATLIGITPSAFLLSYLGKIPPLYQTMVFASLLILLIIGYLVSNKIEKLHTL